MKAAHDATDTFRAHSLTFQPFNLNGRKSTHHPNATSHIIITTAHIIIMMYISHTFVIGVWQ